MIVEEQIVCPATLYRYHPEGSAKYIAQWIVDATNEIKGFMVITAGVSLEVARKFRIEWHMWLDSKSKSGPLIKCKTAVKSVERFLRSISFVELVYIEKG